MQRIPEPGCMRKETVDIDILVTSRNGDRKIMQFTTILLIHAISNNHSTKVA